MAQTVIVSQKELERIAQLAYQGQTLKVMLCNSTGGYDAQSSVSTWQTVEVSGNGYVRGSVAIGTGSYNSSTGKYSLPQVTVDFVATVPGYTYNYVVLYINGATYPHSIVAESPAITLQSGQTQTYKFDLYTDD